MKKKRNTKMEKNTDFLAEEVDAADQDYVASASRHDEEVSNREDAGDSEEQCAPRNSGVNSDSVTERPLFT